jgi:AraC family transcriptional regulator
MGHIDSYWGGRADFSGASPTATLEGAVNRVSAALWTIPADLHYQTPVVAKRDAFFVWLLVRGDCAVKYYRNRLAVQWHRKAGQMSLAVPGSQHRAEIKSNRGFSSLRFYLPPRLIADVVESESYAPRFEAVEFTDLRTAYDARVERIGSDVLDDMRSQMPFSRLRLDVLSHDLAITLLRAHSNLVNTARLARQNQGCLGKRRLNLACERMMASVEHGMTEPTLQELAALVGLSPTQFVRAFAQTTGETPYQWLVNRRIARAKILICSEPRRGLTEIALDVGYTNQSSLGRAFTRVTGITPTAWRREH